MMYILALLASLFVASAQAQTCPTRPPADSSNACASTAFVKAAPIAPAQLPAFVGGDCVTSAGTVNLSCSPMRSTANTWSAPQTLPLIDKGGQFINTASCGTTGAGGDETANIQACINKITSDVGGTVFIPYGVSGSYKITAPLTITHNNIRIVAASRGVTLFTSPAMGANPIFTIAKAGSSQIYAVSISNMTLNVYSDTGIGIQCLHCIEPEIDDVTINGTYSGTTASFGITMQATSNWAGGLRVRGVRMTGLKYGIYQNGASSSYAVTAARISDSWFIGTGATIANSAAITHNAWAGFGSVISGGNDIEGWTIGINDLSSAGSTYVGNRFESNTTDIVLTSASNNSTIGPNQYATGAANISFPFGSRAQILDQGVYFVGPSVYGGDPALKLWGQQNASGPEIQLGNTNAFSTPLMRMVAWGAGSTDQFGNVLSAQEVAFSSWNTLLRIGTIASNQVRLGAASTDIVTLDGATKYTGVKTTSPKSILDVAGAMALAAPTTVTGNYNALDTDSNIVFNAVGSCILNLPAASSAPGRIYRVRTIANQTVVSGASNVIPITGGAAGTAILPATAGKWVDLQSDGTSWQIIAGN